MKNRNSINEDDDFSLVVGGPLYQLFLRTQLARPPIELLYRRLIAFPLLTWLPLLGLSLAAGTAFGRVEIPFVRDVVVHARFLVALPLFLIAEFIVHDRLAAIVKLFTHRNLIAPEDLSRYRAAVTSAARWRNSVWAEVALLVLCYTVGGAFSKNALSLNSEAWYARTGTSGLQLTPAGLWLAWVSIPVFQFMYFRWFYRIVIWTRFLWQVSRIQLQLLVSHPDKSGGLGFLTMSVVAFTPFMIAQSAVLAGLMGVRIFFEGVPLASFKVEVLALLVFQMVIILGPLCVFSDQMRNAKRKGLGKFGTLATRYIEAFERKWSPDQSGVGEKILGAADIQSLADLGNSFQFARQMRIVPFGQEALLQVLFATLLPMVPLVCSVVPFEELVAKLMQIPF